MKIKISETELYEIPHIAWNEYCYYMMDILNMGKYCDFPDYVRAFRGYIHLVNTLA